MAIPISAVQIVDPALASLAAQPSAVSNPQSGSVFQDMFSKAVNTVEGFQTEASTSVQNLLSGANEDVHTPIIATQKADLSFELFMQVRNKVISAYSTLMNMQV
ncbi:MAG TPA: flagellar hook-basal body complex protein FliE [Bryobacteraceae bacterium]|nr:flagellar hook-basal body complex protein FliE [Bryobacteraceae bacterium]